jgi:diguanylate cyclase (GGDEF)-like protein/PAS domain S-box-containing protein
MNSSQNLNAHAVDIDEHFNAVIQTSIDGIVGIDSDNNIIEFNRACELMFGMVRAEVIGRSLSDVIIPERFRTAHELGMRRYLATRKASMLNKVVEISAMRSDKTEFPAELSISHLRGKSGDFFIAYLRDISTRVQAENEARISRDKLQASHDLIEKLASNLPGSIFQLRWTCDGDYEIPFASVGIVKLFELDPNNSRVDAEFLMSRVHPKDIGMFSRSLSESSKTLSLWRKRFRVILPKMGGRWLEGQARPERVSDCETLWHGYIEDVTDRYKTENELQESQQRIQKLLETLPIGMLVHRHGELLYINSAAKQMLGANLSDLEIREVTKDYFEIKNTNQGTEHSTNGQRYRTENFSVEHTELGCIRLNGGSTEIETHSRQISFQGEQAAQVALVDISERKNAQSNLQLAASVFTHTRDGILIANSSKVIVDINDAFTRITGYSIDEMHGRHLETLPYDKGSRNSRELMRIQIQNNNFWEGEMQVKHKQGRTLIAAVSVCMVRDPRGEVQSYIILLSDITIANQHKQQLEYIAHYDSLTKLPNRVLLADRLEQALRRCSRANQHLAVLYLDLDGFKMVNDQHGHNAGDELLAVVSGYMRDALRECDTLARIGGDEFVAIVADFSHPDGFMPILERLLDAASKDVQFGESKRRVSASIGVALYPRDGVDPDILIRRADQAMYMAKEAGKNRFHFFDIESSDATRTKREDMSRLRLALAREEFILYYQPKINISTGLVVGAEALIRWRHPLRGLVPPNEFLPLLEKSQLSIELGEWVIKSAIAQMLLWSDSGLDIPVSVNIGAHQLQQSEFPNRLASILSTVPRLSPKNLQLEVLETSAVENLEQVGASMRMCNSLGVSFALDDFGTGYSSLSHLKHLPASTLKIDRSFINEMLTDANDFAIVNSVFSLARSLGLSVVAEGVETEEQVSMLLGLGCQHAQGYVFAKPMEPSEFSNWMSLQKTNLKSESSSLGQSLAI